LRKWLIDKLLPAIIMGLIMGAVNTYIDVQILKRSYADMRAELTDLWQQSSEQAQKK
jgi:cell division protein ZapA (FtsZ GTPase activity inhibitor)